MKKKIKNLFISVSTLLLIVGISVGITMALLWGKSNEKANVFTGSKGVEVVLSEVNWDGSTATDPTGRADAALLATDGKKIAQTYTPNMVIPKDPILTNLSDDQDVWVMLRVEYTVKAGELSADTYIPVQVGEFNNLAKTQYTELTGGVLKDGIRTTSVAATADENNIWIADASNPVVDDATGHCYYYYYYKTKLNKDGGSVVATKTLFDQVLINGTIGWVELTGADASKKYQITPASIVKYASNYYAYALLPEFQIDVQGVAISVEDGDPTDLVPGTEGTTRTKATIVTTLKSIFDESGSSGT